MKTKIVNILAISTIFSSIYADEEPKNIYVDISKTDILKSSKLGNNIGCGYAIAYNSLFYWNGSFKYNAQRRKNDEEEKVFDYGANLKFGYSFVSDIALYTLGGAIYQNIGKINGSGFGYGGGLEYIVKDIIALSAEYTTYKIDFKGEFDSKYSKASLNIKYLF